MRRQFIISSLLALGMGIAQAQTQPTQPAPMQSGSTDPRQGMQQQQPASPTGAQGMGTSPSDQAGAQSFKGCLNGSSGSWTLTSDKGKSVNVSGTDDQLSPYKGQEVRINGVQASDGSITVASVDKISEACANQTASNTGAQSTTTSQNDINNQSSTSSNTSTSSQSTQTPATSTTPDTSSAATSQTSSTSSNAPGATTPPVTNQTPDNTVGSGQTAQSAQSSTSNTDQNAASSATNQSATSSTGGQNANQGVHQYSDMDQNAGNNAGSKLPQTASPLPLLGLLGLGSLVTGVISRRKK